MIVYTLCFGYLNKNLFYLNKKRNSIPKKEYMIKMVRNLQISKSKSSFNQLIFYKNKSYSFGITYKNKLFENNENSLIKEFNKKNILT